MIRLISLRIVQGILSMVVVSLVVFVLVRLTGDPLDVLLPLSATEEMYIEFAERLRLSEPLPIQYLAYVGDLLRGDLGSSHRTNLPVSDLIVDRLPATLLLGFCALILAVGVAIPLGVYAAYRRGTALDALVRIFAVLGQSMPIFWLGILLIHVFAIQLRWLPAGGHGTPAHLILPSLTLAWFVAAGVLRLMRSSMLEVLRSDYITFARSKGLSESEVLWKHAFRNASIPVLTFTGTIAGSLLTGSIITETVFGWPGLGRLMIDSIAGRDFPVVQGVILFLSAVYLTVNLTVDVLYVHFNPRLREQSHA